MCRLLNIPAEKSRKPEAAQEAQNPESQKEIPAFKSNTNLHTRDTHPSGNHIM